MAKASLEIVLVDKAGNAAAVTPAPITPQQAAAARSTPAGANVAPPVKAPWDESESLFSRLVRKARGAFGLDPPEGPASTQPATAPRQRAPRGPKAKIPKVPRAAPSPTPGPVPPVPPPTPPPIASQVPPPPPPKPPPFPKLTPDKAAVAAKEVGMAEKVFEAGKGAQAALHAGAAGSATSAIAAVGRMAAAAGPAGIAIGALAVSAGAAALGVKFMVDAFSKQVERLGGLSVEIATASAKNEVRSLMADLDRARRVGPQLARFEDTRGKVDQATAHIWTSILEVLTKIFDAALPAIEGGVTVLEFIADQLKTHSKLIAEIVTWSAAFGAGLPGILLKVLSLFWKRTADDDADADGDLLFAQFLAAADARGGAAAVIRGGGRAPLAAGL